MNPSHLSLDDKLELEAVLKYLEIWIHPSSSLSFIRVYQTLILYKRYHANTIAYLDSDTSPVQEGV